MNPTVVRRTLTRERYLKLMEGRTTPLGHVMSNTRARNTPMFQRADTFADWIINNLRLPMTAAQLLEREQAIGADRVRQPSAKCGTDAGYQLHRQKGEETCQLCRLAHRQVNLRYKKKDAA